MLQSTGATGDASFPPSFRIAFDEEVAALDRSRSKPGQLLTAYYRQTQASVFGAYVATQEDVEAGTPRMHVVSAPVGSGKTSAAIALVSAHVKTGGTALVVVNQIKKADETYKDLLGLLGADKVAVWTSEHDAVAREQTDKYEAKFTKDDLQNYAVAIVTHRMFSDRNSHKARCISDGSRRTLTVIDESMDEVEIYDITFASAAAVRAGVLALEGWSSASEALTTLVDFMHDKGCNGLPAIDKPAPDDVRLWSGLQWFKTQEARDYASRSRVEHAAHVFGFARCLLDGYSFILKGTEADGNTRYIGYENKLTIDPGTLLLDATADIDGVQQLGLSDRSFRPVPRADYRNLHVVAVQPPTKERLSKFLSTAKNQQRYVAWMLDTIKQHMEPGEKGLVVCKKFLIDNQNVPNWPQGDERYEEPERYTEDYGWDVDGRHLSVANWGAGIGSNTWQDAHVVFLFDAFFRPRRVTIATTQGLKRAKNTQGPLASMRAQNGRHAEVDAIWEGHLLRWAKQLALRGNARRFDGQGVCGVQKLVFAADRTRLLANFDRLFPGARIEVVSANTDTKQTYADKLIEVLSRPDLPDTVSTKWIGQQMKKPWRDASKHVMGLDHVKRSIAALGWTYKPGRGRGAGSTFERVLKQPIEPLAMETTDTGDTRAVAVAVALEAARGLEVAGGRQAC